MSDNPWESIEESLKIGSKVRGKVSKVTAFGAFIEIENGLEGLVHVTELSDQAFGKVEDIVAVGDEVEAKVIKIDPERKKIALSIKDYLIEQGKVNRDDIVVSKKNEDDEDEEKEEQ